VSAKRLMESVSVREDCRYSAIQIRGRSVAAWLAGDGVFEITDRRQAGLLQDQCTAGCSTDPSTGSGGIGPSWLVSMLTTTDIPGRRRSISS
jgi:hypothetical protein